MPKRKKRGLRPRDLRRLANKQAKFVGSEKAAVDKWMTKNNRAINKLLNPLYPGLKEKVLSIIKGQSANCTPLIVASEYIPFKKNQSKLILKFMTTHPTTIIRLNAIIALGAIAPTEKRKLLPRLLTDSSEGIRIHAALSCDELNAVETVPLLEKSLNDKDFFVRSQVAQALGVLGSKHSLKVLRNNFSTQPQHTRRYITAAIKSIEKRLEK